MKKFLTKIFIAAAAVCGICATGLNSSAATVDEVAATARRYGIPETVIQQGYSRYYSNPDAYESADFDMAISYIEQYYQEIINRFGGSTGGGQSSTETTQPGTEKPSDTSTSEPAENTQSPVTDSPDNSVTGNRISKEEFIKMTLEEKQAYVASLPEAEREEFLRTLSAEELKSIVKQLPTDDKAAIVDKFVQAGDAMGVKVTVDEITDENVSMIMRDENGQLIDVTTVGVIVEDTGYDYTLLFAVSGICVLAAAGGLWMIIRRCFTEENTEE